MVHIEIKKDGRVVYVKENAGLSHFEQIKQDVLHVVEQPDFDKKVDKFFKKYAIPAAVSVGILNVATQVSAMGNTDVIATKMMPIIKMIQDLALPIGILVASWGLIEVIIGNFPAGKEKIKYAVIGFMGMFIIPEVFYTIRDIFGAK